MPDLRDLYQEVILEHSKQPRNYRELANATQKAEGFNPLCGDHFTVHRPAQFGDLLRAFADEYHHQVYLGVVSGHRGGDRL